MSLDFTYSRLAGKWFVTHWARCCSGWRGMAPGRSRARGCDAPAVACSQTVQGEAVVVGCCFGWVRWSLMFWRMQDRVGVLDAGREFAFPSVDVVPLGQSGEPVVGLDVGPAQVTVVSCGFDCW